MVVFDVPPAILAPVITVPLCGFNHSTLSESCVLDKFTVNGPLPGWYTNHSVPPCRQ